MIYAGRKSKLAREVEGRGWTARDLAVQIGVPPAEANALIRGGQRITPELARKLGTVFATSSEYWLHDEE
jgi:plasmid maintenance system antidote protein VapI